MNLQQTLYLFSVTLLALSSCNTPSSDVATNKPSQPFPFEIPSEKPEFKLSTAMERAYDDYGAATPQDNELYSLFKYTLLEGFDYNNNNGTISRRDPTRIVKVGDTYYMWYTLRRTKEAPTVAQKATDEIPSVDWDLSDIGYATSKDGFTWEEKGVAVHRPTAPTIGHRSISTPEILVWKGKYYLYFQAFSDMSGKQNYDCPVAMAESDSPDGPWTFIDKIVIPNGGEGEWDQYAIHDPLPMVFKGKIYMYYKSDYNGRNLCRMRSQGVAIADNPKGPFVKCDVNPIISSGHETHLFRFKEGIAAILPRDGQEHNTIQYSEDGVNFKIASITHGELPQAGAFYDPDAFTDTKFAHGVTWGVSQYHQFLHNAQHSVLLRYDCDLSLDLNDPEMKANHYRTSLKDILKIKLSPKQKKRILESM